MAIELHIQTKSGRLEDNKEPSTAFKINIDDFTQRELNQFYLNLKHCVRHIESVIDDELKEE